MSYSEISEFDRDCINAYKGQYRIVEKWFSLEYCEWMDKSLAYSQRKVVKKMQKKPRTIGFSLDIHQNYLND